MSNFVEVFELDGKWVVKVVEGDGTTESEFISETHANSWARGQQIRIEAAPPPNDIPVDRS